MSFDGKKRSASLQSSAGQPTTPPLTPLPRLTTRQSIGSASYQGSEASSSYFGTNAWGSDYDAEAPSSATTSVSANASVRFPASPSASVPSGSPSILPLNAGVAGDRDSAQAANVFIDDLNPPDIVSFDKGSKSFKLSYSRMLIAKAPFGEVRRIELSGYEPDGLFGGFVHTFPNSRVPVPHIEQPITSKGGPPFVVSFLEEQMVQAAGVLFNAQPHYTFNNWDDVVRFQEALLGQRMAFIAGVATVKSKGRGEESISQNVRIWQSYTSSRQTIFVFANSQRKGNKRYLSISVDDIDSIEERKDSVTLRLNQNANDMLAKLRTLQIEFLEPSDLKSFCATISHVRSSKGKGKT